MSVHLNHAAPVQQQSCCTFKNLLKLSAVVIVALAAINTYSNDLQNHAAKLSRSFSGPNFQEIAEQRRLAISNAEASCRRLLTNEGAKACDTMYQGKRCGPTQDMVCDGYWTKLCWPQPALNDEHLDEITAYERGNTGNSFECSVLLTDVGEKYLQQKMDESDGHKIALSTAGIDFPSRYEEYDRSNTPRIYRDYARASLWKGDEHYGLDIWKSWIHSSDLQKDEV